MHLGSRSIREPIRFQHQINHSIHFNTLNNIRVDNGTIILHMEKRKEKKRMIPILLPSMAVASESVPFRRLSKKKKNKKKVRKI